MTIRPMSGIRRSSRHRLDADGTQSSGTGGARDAEDPRARAAAQLRRQPAYATGGGADRDGIAGLHGDGADRGERRHPDRP
jgi:hypothetical protein